MPITTLKLSCQSQRILFSDGPFAISTQVSPLCESFIAEIFDLALFFMSFGKRGQELIALGSGRTRSLAEHCGRTHAHRARSLLNEGQRRAGCRAR